MAQRGRPIPAATMMTIRKLRQIMSLRATAREADVCKDTVIKYADRNKKETLLPSTASSDEQTL